MWAPALERGALKKDKMANELLNPVVITQESLIRLENNLCFAKYVNRELTSSSFGE